MRLRIKLTGGVLKIFRDSSQSGFCTVKMLNGSRGWFFDMSRLLSARNGKKKALKYTDEPRSVENYKEA